MRIKVNERSMIRGKSQSRMVDRRGSPSHDTHSLDSHVSYGDDRERHSEERHYPYQQYQERSHPRGQGQPQHHHQVNRYRSESVHSQDRSRQGSVTRPTTTQRSNSDPSDHHNLLHNALDSMLEPRRTVDYGDGGSLSSKTSYNSSLTGAPSLSFQRSLSTPDAVPVSLRRTQSDAKPKNNSRHKKQSGSAQLHGFAKMDQIGSLSKNARIVTSQQFRDSNRRKGKCQNCGLIHTHIVQRLNMAKPQPLTVEKECYVGWCLNCFGIGEIRQKNEVKVWEKRGGGPPDWVKEMERKEKRKEKQGLLVREGGRRSVARHRSEGEPSSVGQPYARSVKRGESMALRGDDGGSLLSKQDSKSTLDTRESLEHSLEGVSITPSVSQHSATQHSQQPYPTQHPQQHSTQQHPQQQRYPTQRVNSSRRLNPKRNVPQYNSYTDSTIEKPYLDRGLTSASASTLDYPSYDGVPPSLLLNPEPHTHTHNHNHNAHQSVHNTTTPSIDSHSHSYTDRDGYTDDSASTLSSLESYYTQGEARYHIETHATHPGDRYEDLNLDTLPGILDVLARPNPHPTHQLWALQSLLTQPLQTEPQHLLMRAITLLVSTLSVPNISLELSTATLHALSIFLDDKHRQEDYCSLIALKNGIPSILARLRIHDATELQTHGLSILRAVMESSPGNNFVKGLVIDHEGIEIFTRAMFVNANGSANSGGISSVVEDGCILLWSLGYNGDSAVLERMEGVFCADAILAGMKGHPGDSGVQKFGCGALHTLSCHSESMRRTMIENRGVEIVTRAIGGREDEDRGPLVEMGLCALTSLLLPERSDDTSIATNKTHVTVATVDIEVILVVMNAMIRYPIKTVQKHGCKIYRLLSRNRENVHLMRDTMRPSSRSTHGVSSGTRISTVWDALVRAEQLFPKDCAKSANQVLDILDK